MNGRKEQSVLSPVEKMNTNVSTSVASLLILNRGLIFGLLNFVVFVWIPFYHIEIFRHH